MFLFHPLLPKEPKRILQGEDHNAHRLDVAEEIHGYLDDSRVVGFALNRRSEVFPSKKDPKR